MFALDTFNKKEQLLQLPTKCSCNNLQKCFATFCKKVLQKTNKQLDAFMTETLKTLEEIKNACPGKMPIFDDRKFRAVFFDYYKQHNGISVIIGTFQKECAGYTTKRSHSERDTQREIMNIIGIKFKERQICVFKKECMKSIKLVYNEEEEVI